MTSTRTAADTLRAVADLIEAHPDLPPPYVSLYDHRPDVAELKWFLHINETGGAEEQRATAQALLRGYGGKWDKEFLDNDARFRQKRDGLSLLVVAVRESVCTRRVVGTEEVTVPAVDAQPERVEVREVVEWDCEPVLTVERIGASA